MRNEVVLHRFKKDRNILHTLKLRKVDWVGHMSLRNSLLKHIIQEKLEGGVEVKVRRGRRRKQLLNELKETRGHWKLKQEALNRSL
jgi:hypothetical protein